MSVGGSSGTSQTVTQLDPQLKQDWMDTYARAQSTANAPVPTQTVAPLSNLENRGIDMTVAGAGAGTPAVSDAISRYAAVGDQGPALAGTDHYSTHQAQAPDASLYGFRDVNAPGASASTVDRGQVRDVGAPGFSADALAPFQNPWTDQVVGRAMGDIEQQRQRAINGNSSDFTLGGGEGGWNGSRAGVADALTNEAALKQAGDTSAALRSQGFDTAAGLFGDQANRTLTAGQNNQSADLGVASTNAGLLSDNSRFNAGQRLTAQQNNQAADLTRSGAIYGTTADINERNAAAETQKERDNASFNNQTSQFNAGQTAQQRALALDAASREAAAGGQQQEMALTGAGAVNAAGGQQRAVQQAGNDAAYQDAMNARNLPLQTLESAFGIIPNTGNGGTSSTHSAGKSGSI
jgi:hypothetical protein